MALPPLTADDCDRRADEIEEALSRAQVYPVAEETLPRLLRTVGALLRKDHVQSPYGLLPLAGAPGTEARALPPPVVSETELQELHRLRETMSVLRSAHQASCGKDGCLVCGILDCPDLEPLHHDKDGCPSCADTKDVPAALDLINRSIKPFWLKSEDFERLDEQAIEAYASVTYENSAPLWSALNRRGGKAILTRIYGIGWDEAWKVSDRIVARLTGLLNLVHMVFEDVEFVPKDQAAVFEAVRAWKHRKRFQLPDEQTIQELRAQSKKEMG